MRALALDQSLTSCGWALFDGKGATIGSWPLAENAQQRQRAAGFNALRAKLTEIHKDGPLDWVAFEAPLKTRIDALQKLRGLLGLTATIESWCVFRNIPMAEVDQRNWRASWLGDSRKGVDRAQLKILAVDRARQFGFDPLNSDSAEALAIMDHVLLAEKITPPWRNEQPFLLTI